MNVARATTLTARRDAGVAPMRWAWARHWEFWLALAVGAALRLWRLDLAQFLDDQAQLMILARASMTRGLIPLTGIPSSIRTLNPPITIYPLLPFAAFTANPMPVVISIALWNIAGVALCYIFTLRYFGRRVAAFSALLFASCGSAILYSRFIWQQNYLPPLIILWVFTLYLGCIECRRGWLVANVALLAIAALLHPTAALLAPVTLVAAMLAPRFPRWRAWGASAVILLALALPTLVWEFVSGFHDLHALRRYAASHSQINGAVFYYLYVAIGGPDPAIAGSRLPLIALNALVTLLFATGWIVLTVRILRPARALPWRRESGLAAAARAWLIALYRGLRADTAWRINLLLWLSVSVPVTLMIRHSSNLFTHYLIVVYPSAFIVSGIGAVSAIAWLARQVRARNARLAPQAVLALEMSMLLLILARSAQWLTFPTLLTNAAAFHAYGSSGDYAHPASMYGNYGYPLSVIQNGSAQLAQLQQHTGATTVEVIIPDDTRSRSSTEYVFAAAKPDRVTMTPSCLLLPASSSAASWLITSTLPNTPAASLLARVAASQPVGSLRMTGGPDYPVYQVSGPGAALADQRSITPVPFVDSAGDSLQLVGIAPLGANSLVARWNVVAASAPDTQSRFFTVNATAGAQSGYATCEAERWRAGETLYTILPLAPGAGDLRLILQTGTTGLDIHSAGPLRFLSGLDGGQAPVAMKPTGVSSGAAPHQVVVNADGSVTLSPPSAP